MAAEPCSLIHFSMLSNGSIYFVGRCGLTNQAHPQPVAAVVERNQKEQMKKNNERAWTPAVAVQRFVRPLCGCIKSWGSQTRIAHVSASGFGRLIVNLLNLGTRRVTLRQCRVTLRIRIHQCLMNYKLVLLYLLDKQACLSILRELNESSKKLADLSNRFKCSHSDKWPNDQAQAQAREMTPRRSRGAANLPRRPKLRTQRLLPAAILLACRNLLIVLPMRPPINADACQKYEIPLDQRKEKKNNWNLYRVYRPFIKRTLRKAKKHTKSGRHVEE